MWLTATQAKSVLNTEKLPCPHFLPETLAAGEPSARPSAFVSHAQDMTLGIGVGALDSGTKGHGISISDMIDMPCRVTHS